MHLVMKGAPLDEPALCMATCVLSAYSWSASNDSWSTEALLEELAAIMFVRQAIDFPLNIYTN